MGNTVDGLAYNMLVLIYFVRDNCGWLACEMLIWIENAGEASPYLETGVMG